MSRGEAFVPRGQPSRMADDTHPDPDPLDGEYEYAQVTVDDLPDAPNPTRGKREVDEAVGARGFGYNVFVADPGEELPWGYHYHPDHEEVLHVLAGELRVETAAGERHVEAGEVLYIPPNHPQKAVAVGDDPARVIAVGAPKDADGATIVETCEACGERTDREFEATEVDGTQVYVLSCAGCGAETDRFRPGPAE
jgi:quercetin dioxygenase-like cupin family protein